MFEIFREILVIEIKEKGGIFCLNFILDFATTKNGGQIWSKILAKGWFEKNEELWWLPTFALSVGEGRECRNKQKILYDCIYFVTLIL